MIKKNHTYKITTEEKKDLIVTPIEHTPKVVETVEQNEVTLENQATQNIVECTEERINEISQATGKDPLQVEYELKEKAYKDYQKEHERITQRLRIEKDRGSWVNVEEDFVGKYSLNVNIITLLHHTQFYSLFSQ